MTAKLLDRLETPTLASAYTMGDPDITVDTCPQEVIDKGPEFAVVIDGILFRVTDTGGGSTTWDVTRDPRTADHNIVSGSPVYIWFAAWQIEELLAALAASITALETTIPVASDDDPLPTAIASDPGVSPDFSRSDHTHEGAVGGGGGSGPLVNIDAHLSSDFPLTTDGQWYDVLSVSLPPGTYKAQGMALVQSNHVAPWGAARIWDGTNVYGSGNASLPALNNVLTFTIITKEFVLATTTTLYLSCAAHGGSSVVAAQTFDPSAEPMSTILAVQGQGSAAAVETVLSDDFNRANVAPPGDPVIGATPLDYVDYGATPARWGVVSNQLAPVISESESAITWPVYSPKFTMTCTLATPGADGGPVFRVDGEANWFFLQTVNSGVYRLYWRVSASYSLLATGSSTPTAGDVIEIVVTGSTIDISINGSPEISLNSGRLNHGMMVGFRENNATTLRIDDLTVTVP